MPHTYVVNVHWSRLCGVSLLCLTPWLSAVAEPNRHHALITTENLNTQHLNIQKDIRTEFRTKFSNWQRQHINKTRISPMVVAPFRGQLSADSKGILKLKPTFPAPPKWARSDRPGRKPPKDGKGSGRSNSRGGSKGGNKTNDRMRLNLETSSASNLKLQKNAGTPLLAKAAPQFGSIILDGDLSDWSVNDQINLPDNLPPYLASGDVLYGRYIASPTPVYVIAIHSKTVAIAPNTTLWLNTDQNPTTGYSVWGQYGGAEHFINIFSNSTPHLYDSTLSWVKGPLDHAYSADSKILELAIPLSDLSPPATVQGMDIIADINDTIFLPAFYDTGEQYTIANTAPVLPPRTDFSKRIGIVYSETSKNNFFGDKAYSQLFMSVQHQAMMAGIPFDLLNENDLTNINNLVNYDALIFPSAAYIPNAIRNQVHDTLFKAVYHYNIGIITSGDWLTSNESGGSISGDAYRYMKQLLGLGRVSGDGPVNMALKAGDIDHPVMKGYVSNESIQNLTANWFSYYQAVPNQPTNGLAVQTITGGSMAGTYDAVLASTTGGRNVHFSTLGYMGDTNMLWQAIQWVVYNENTTVGLKMGRENNLFVPRNDMDDAMEHDQVSITHVPLLNLLEDWKDNYNFVGSYFIDIGNTPQTGQWTDWFVSTPLFQDYIGLSNEIGTHSWTHPHLTDQLNNTQIEFEFNQSMTKIATELGPTWNNQAIRGAAVPGAPENTATAENISQYLDYLSGGFSGPGAGFQSAFGYLKPNSGKVYFSPNMAFDFTLIQFGVPVGNPPVPTPMNAVQAEQYWVDQYATLMKHASQPIIHWPWHDYGPTTSTDPVTGDGYTVAMYENTISMAANDDSEFATSADVAQRIDTLRNANLTITGTSPTITATVQSGSTNVGKFSLEVDTADLKIQKVDGWYAYDEERVFLDQNAGTYTIHLGATADPVTRIQYLSARTKLISLNGNGQNLSYSIEGEGSVDIWVDNTANYTYSGADSVTIINSHEVELHYDSYGVHTGTVTHL